VRNAPTRRLAGRRAAVHLWALRFRAVAAGLPAHGRRFRGAAGRRRLAAAACSNSRHVRVRPRRPSRCPGRTTPSTWPIFKGNHAIKNGLQQETGTTLKVYNWTAYINQAVVDSFAKKYNCKVQVSTFKHEWTRPWPRSTAARSTSTCSWASTIDVLGPLIEQKFIQPLNHSYIPNITQAWPDFQNPFYDGKWQYTVPYTIYNDRHRLA